MKIVKHKFQSIYGGGWVELEARREGDIEVCDLRLFQSNNFYTVTLRTEALRDFRETLEVMLKRESLVEPVK